MKQSPFDLTVGAVIHTIVIVSLLLCIIPILFVVATSLSSNSAIIQGKVTLLPVETTGLAYEQILSDKSMTWSLVFTIFITVLYTIIAMILTICAAYALTKKRLKGRMVVMGVIVFTMYFSGGLIPDYILMLNLDFIDKIWCLVLPGAISAYNMVIMKSFFANLPDSYEEAAILDGCNDVQLLIKIVLPLSLPVIATVSLWYAVGRWNGFMDALFYINDPSLYPLQLKLYNIVMNATSIDIATQEGMNTGALPESIKAACLVFATVPILIVYPFLQKYFVQGSQLGGVKG